MDSPRTLFDRQSVKRQMTEKSCPTRTCPNGGLTDPVGAIRSQFILQTMGFGLGRGRDLLERVLNSTIRFNATSHRLSWIFRNNPFSSQTRSRPAALRRAERESPDGLSVAYGRHRVRRGTGDWCPPCLRLVESAETPAITNTCPGSGSARDRGALARRSRIWGRHRVACGRSARPRVRCRPASFVRCPLGRPIRCILRDGPRPVLQRPESHPPVMGECRSVPTSGRSHAGPWARA